MPSPATQDRIEFEKFVHNLWHATLAAATTGDNVTALAPSNCSDFETERRKHELVKHAVAAGLVNAEITPFADCIAEE